MATWKKLVVSGSSAELSALKVDSLSSGQVVIGGGQASNLTTTAINGTGNIVATSGATGVSMTGSFTGSFYGDGSNLSGVVATNPNALTSGEGISSFSYNGLYAQTVAVSGAADLTDNILTKWDNTANKFTNSSLTDNGTTVTGNTSLQLTGANSSITGSFSGSFSGEVTSTVTSASYAVTASYVLGQSATSSYALTASYVLQAVSSSYSSTALQLVNALTLGNGLTGTSYDGSSPITAAVGAGALIGVGTGITYVNTSSLSSNQLPKYSSNALAGSNVSDDGSTITLAGTTTNVTSTNFQVGTNKFTVNSGTGNTTVAGTLEVTGNTTITGDLTVSGTASFQNTQNLLVADQFILLASGSSTLVDGGIIVANGTNGSGSAWYLETTSAGDYGRWAVTSMLDASASAATADEYAVTAKINQASTPTVAPTWGGASSGTGNMWITNGGDIYIYA